MYEAGILRCHLLKMQKAHKERGSQVKAHVTSNSDDFKDQQKDA